MVDEDGSSLSRRIRDALLPPRFQPPAPLTVQEIDAGHGYWRYTFVIDIPPDFQTDVVRGRRPAIQLNVDATAMTRWDGRQLYPEHHRAGTHCLPGGPATVATPPRAPVIRAQFNPNLDVTPFMAVVQLINSITLIAMFLAGAALIREREHGTIEHLLVMPLTPTEIMLAKIWANGLVIVRASALSLRLVVQAWLGLAIAGSMALFVGGVAIYLFAIASLSIFLATLARSMPQFALLAFPVFIIMNLLSGGNTPLDSMPAAFTDGHAGLTVDAFCEFPPRPSCTAGRDSTWCGRSSPRPQPSVRCSASALWRFRKALTAVQM